MKIFKRREFDIGTRIKSLKEFGNDYVATGSSRIDKMLGGGLPVGFVTHVFGPPGSGKTNLCLSAASKVGKNEKVLFIDTEGGFSPERLQQICGKLPENFFVKQPKDFDEQGRVVRGLGRVLDDKFKLVVIDSVVSLYRLRIDNKRDKVLEMARELGRELAQLSKLARENKLAVVVSNQVYSSFDGKEEIVPVGGDTLMYWSKLILELKKEKEDGFRSIIIRKHPHKPEGKGLKFKISSSGLE
jgi:DNA repair protein RadB|tara:strand:+ start:1876 stop:2604 length:729 start_codon:yes stop_codon:yes gene_type:complete